MLIGCWLEPVHQVPHRLADAWRRLPALPSAPTEWQALLELEAARSRLIVAALIEQDNGDGAMIEWAGNWNIPAVTAVACKIALVTATHMTHPTP